MCYRKYKRYLENKFTSLVKIEKKIIFSHCQHFYKLSRHQVSFTAPLFLQCMFKHVHTNYKSSPQLVAVYD